MDVFDYGCLNLDSGYLMLILRQIIRKHEYIFELFTSNEFPALTYKRDLLLTFGIFTNLHEFLPEFKPEFNLLPSSPCQASNVISNCRVEG